MNDLHKRALVSGCRDLHNRLAEMESMLVQAASGHVFSEYIDDLQPADRTVLRDYFSRLRQALEQGLAELGIAVEVRRRSVRWWLQCAATFLSICLAEMVPSRLRGYGPLSAHDARQLEKVQAEWQRWVRRIAEYLREPPLVDLSQRLACAPERLRALLARLQQMILRYDLVEYLPLWQALVAKLESPRFEVAVFGRVNSGKSSLLNAVIGRAVLPVGITPVTAVPIRVQAGQLDSAIVYFAALPPRTIPLSELADYATEQHNPHNCKQVSEIVISLKSERLMQKIVLVDTPGLGSLADAGAQQSLAYLPRCDLGLVVVEATAPLSPADLHLLTLLNQAGIASQVLLSKADLLSQQDQHIVLEYVQHQLRHHLGQAWHVFLVSTKPEWGNLFDSWLQQGLLPALAQHQEQLHTLLVRRTVRLAENIAQLLQTRLPQLPSDATVTNQNRGTTNKYPVDTPNSPQAFSLVLEQAETAIVEWQRNIRDWLQDVPKVVDDLIGCLAATLAQLSVTAIEPSDDVIQAQLRQQIDAFFYGRGQRALRLAESCQQTLAQALSQLIAQSRVEQVDADLISNWRWQGLPTWEVPELAVLHIPPWWTRWAPRLAASVIHQRLRRQLGHALQQLVEIYERQLQAWLKTHLGQLIRIYEDQVALLRIWRSVEIPSHVSESRTEPDNIHADLAQLYALMRAD